MKNTSSSLQGRLIGLVLAGVLLIWLLTAIFTWFDTRHELDELLDGHLAQAAALLVAQQSQAPHLAEDEADEEKEHIDAPVLHRYAPKVMFQVFHEGKLTLHSTNAPVQPLLSSVGEFQAGFATVALKGESWRVFSAYGAQRDVRVYVAEQTRSRMEVMWAVLRGALWPLLVALPLLTLAAWWAIYRGIAPMRKLSQEIELRHPEAMEAIDLTEITAEMRPLVTALNRLFARIHHLLQAERRFTADAAHELRTPIAAIRAHAQVAYQENDAELRQHALAATIQGCDRTSRVVEQLLTLARVEAGTPPAMQTLNLGQLIQALVAEIAVQALTKGQVLEVDAAQECYVHGNDTLLTILLRNLLDNAIRYCPPDSRIHLSVKQSATQIELTLEDSGAGLSESDLPRLGERFFRVQDNLATGSGLGWSIVRRIADVHGFSIQRGRSPSLGGLLVQLSMPSSGAGMQTPA